MEQRLEGPLEARRRPEVAERAAVTPGSSTAEGLLGEFTES